jgi:hypothetical protein
MAVWLAWLVVSRGAAAPRAAPSRWLPFAVAGLCPLVLHGSFFLDIDNTTLCAAVLLMAWLHAVLPVERPWQRRAVLGAAFALALWSKLATAPFMLTAIAIELAARGRVRQAVGDAVVVGAIGATLFAASYGLYCWALEYPARFMFDVTYLGKSDQYLLLPPLARMAQALRWNVVWISPPLMAAFAVVLVVRVRRRALGPGSEPADVLIIFALITLCAYTLAGVMGKYTAPAAVCMAVVVGAETARALRSLLVQNRAGVAAATGVLAGLHVFAIAPLTVRPARVETPTTIAAMIADPRLLQLVVAVAAGIAFTALAIRWMRSIHPGGRILAALLLWLAAANAPAELRVAAAPFDRSPLRPFEDRGFPEAVAFLNEHAGPGDRILCPKDVGYAYKGRYYALEPTGPGWTLGQQLAPARAGDVRFVVDSTMYPLVPDPQRIEQAGFARTATIGDYAVYERARQ